MGIHTWTESPSTTWSHDHMSSCSQEGEILVRLVRHNNDTLHWRWETEWWRRERQEGSKEKVDREDKEQAFFFIWFICAGKIRGTQNKCCRLTLKQKGVCNYENYLSLTTRLNFIHTLTGHFIRYILPAMGCTSFCLQISSYKRGECAKRGMKEEWK